MAAMGFKTSKQYHELSVSAVIQIKGCLRALKLSPPNIAQDQYELQSDVLRLDEYFSQGCD
jgi:hypothetical protein